MVQKNGSEKMVQEKWFDKKWFDKNWFNEKVGLKAKFHRQHSLAMKFWLKVQEKWFK